MPSKPQAASPKPLLFDFGPPPKRRLACPIYDCHTHVGSPSVTRSLVTVARRYGVSGLMGICGSVDEARKLRDAFPSTFQFAIRLDFSRRDDPPEFVRSNTALLEAAAEFGFRMVKFWCAPPFRVRFGMTLDDPLLQPVFERIASLGLRCLVHVADPDAWFDTVYADAAVYGTKAENYAQLENVLRTHSAVIFQGAHFAGDPEHLDHVADLLDRYPNYCIDTSATKWIARELSRQRDRARQFAIGYADRIVFGSDLAMWRGVTQRHCTSRYWVHQMLWETDCTGPSPIRDPDAGGQAAIRGLNLPDDALERIYHLNARRLGLF